MFNRIEYIEDIPILSNMTISTTGFEIAVRPVINRRDLKSFINFPYYLYRRDPNWAPQIRLLEKIEYYRGNNPVLSRSPHQLLLAETARGKITGRIIIYSDPRHNAHHGTNLGFFGAFEAEDEQTAAALLSAAEKWITNNNLDGILGPIDPVAECWGVVVEGFEHPPIFLSPHNPPEYGRWIETAGFKKAKDLLVYDIDTGKKYTIPSRYSIFEEQMLIRRPDLKVRPMNTRKLKQDAFILLKLLNEGIDGNWGFTPIGDEELDSLVEKLKLIADPDAIWFLEDRGNPVGCALGFPDLNMILRRIKGRLLPFGWIRLLRARHSIKDYRLWALALLPGYQGQGLDVLLYMNLYRALRPRGIRLEANYVLEDNPHIINALEKLGMNRIKRYRVYEKML
ncbi:MAG: GNAT family N-acetyltransferase [Spirochaetaceae bacterium]|nr:GNAT family N-acetyltransferase [Spirochaetaceae bacterium]